MSAVLQMSVTLVSETCCTCGVEFAMPKHLQDTLRSNKHEFFCPNGHNQAYLKSTVDQLKEQLAAANAEKERHQRMRADAEAARDRHFEARTKAEKKLARAKNGVCPCCKRSFTALRRHMASKHPEWKPTQHKGES